MVISGAGPAAAAAGAASAAVDVAGTTTIAEVQVASACSQPPMPKWRAVQLAINKAVVDVRARFDSADDNGSVKKCAEEDQLFQFAVSSIRDMTVADWRAWLNSEDENRSVKKRAEKGREWLNSGDENRSVKKRAEKDQPFQCAVSSMKDKTTVEASESTGCPEEVPGMLAKVVRRNSFSDVSTAPSTPEHRSRLPSKPALRTTSKQRRVQLDPEPLQTNETDSMDSLLSKESDTKTDYSDSAAAAKLTLPCSRQQSSTTPRRCKQRSSLVERELHKLRPDTLNMASVRADLECHASSPAEDAKVSADDAKSNRLWTWHAQYDTDHKVGNKSYLDAAASQPLLQQKTQPNAAPTTGAATAATVGTTAAAAADIDHWNATVPVLPAFQNHMPHKMLNTQLSPIAHKSKRRGVLSRANGAKHKDVGQIDTCIQGRGIALPNTLHPLAFPPTTQLSPGTLQGCTLGMSVTKH